MFITTPDGELTFHNAFFGSDGTKHWSYVELTLHVPWFCVQIRQEEDDAHIGRTFHFSDVRQFVALSVVDGVSIEQVALVLPSHFTGKDGWTMQTLRAIWSGAAPDGSIQHICVTKTGKRYSHFNCESGLHEQDLVNRQRVFNCVGTQK